MRSSAINQSLSGIFPRKIAVSLKSPYGTPNLSHLFLFSGLLWDILILRRFWNVLLFLWNSNFDLIKGLRIVFLFFPAPIAKMSILGFGRFLICRLLIQVDGKIFAAPALRILRVFERGHPVKNIVNIIKSKIYKKLIKLNIWYSYITWLKH